MTRKLTRKGAIRKLDSICREIIHIRDKHKCRKCGVYVNPGEVHHIIPKKRGYHVRWTLNNLILLCNKHHRPYFHSDPFAMEWFKEADPDAYAIIQELNQHQTESFKQQDLLDYIETLESEIKAMQC
jgi:5-methylcytosine-specific restriction endonuclease McrA